jgi:fructose-1-phosphate kinase PfkB-like protein
MKKDKNWKKETKIANELSNQEQERLENYSNQVGGKGINLQVLLNNSKQTVNI